MSLLEIIHDYTEKSKKLMTEYNDKKIDLEQYKNLDKGLDLEYKTRLYEVIKIDPNHI